MARDKRRQGGGRVTPRKDARNAAGRAGRQPVTGERRRLFRLNAPVEGPVTAGRRPSNPATLLVIALGWIACGVVAIVALSAGWKLIPGIAFIGIGLLFLRGAAAGVARGR